MENDKAIEVLKKILEKTISHRRRKGGGDDGVGDARLGEAFQEQDEDDERETGSEPQLAVT